MLKQGKHAFINLYKAKKRVFKTYSNKYYTDNEYHTLISLDEIGFLKLYPEKESDYTLSFDWIQDTKTVQLSILKDRSIFIDKLVKYLLSLHNISYSYYGKYINHRDIFEDNVLLFNNSDELFFIDWGLSRKTNTTYPDIASIMLGILNNYPEDILFFLKKYFHNLCNIDYELLNSNIDYLYDEYFCIRKENYIETESLKLRLNQAKTVLWEINSLCYL